MCLITGSVSFADLTASLSEPGGVPVGFCYASASCSEPLTRDVQQRSVYAIAVMINPQRSVRAGHQYGLAAEPPAASSAATSLDQVVPLCTTSAIGRSLCRLRLLTVCKRCIEFIAGESPQMGEKGRYAIELMASRPLAGQPFVF